MTRVSLAAVLLAAVSCVSANQAPTSGAEPSSTAKVRHEIIAVYFGTEGTDLESGMVSVVRDMKVSLTSQAMGNDQRFISRGVSLEPSVDRGMRHLSALGRFDEVSVGGNWTNSSVVRYLGNSSRGDNARVPQVVLLTREVRHDGPQFDIAPEREIGRYIGTDVISAWVRRGAPIPK